MPWMACEGSPWNGVAEINLSHAALIGDGFAGASTCRFSTQWSPPFGFLFRADKRPQTLKAILSLSRVAPGGQGAHPV